MTWRELKKRIEQMRPSELDRPVRFVESNDKGKSVIEVNIEVCDERLASDNEPTNNSNTVYEGELFLQ